jgi:hypothetical protein
VAEIQDGTRFTPDHDQRHAVSATAAFADAAHGWRVAGALRYQTGTPVGLAEDASDDLRARRGSAVVDFASGRVRPYSIADVQGEWTFLHGDRGELSWVVSVTNITGELYAFNFGNAFSGTHFGSPRRVAVNLRARLRQ